MTFEVSVRNTGLGLVLVFAYFDGLGGMALVAAWWGLYDILAGLVVAALWRRRTADVRPRPAVARMKVLVTGGSGFLGQLGRRRAGGRRPRGRQRRPAPARGR